MPRIQGFLKSLLLAFMLAGFISVSAPQPATAQARARIQAKTPDEFMRFYCANVKIRPGDIEALIKALQDLLAALEYIRLDLGSFRLELNPPMACLPNFNFNLNIPGLDSLLACLNQLNFKVEITPPNLNGVGQCLAGLLPSLNLQLPNFDPNQMLSCLGNFNATVDIGSLLQGLNNIIQAISELIAALKNLIPSIQAYLDPNFMMSIKWMASFCRRNRARYR